MADYLTARAAIATLLGAVSISSPISATLTAYETMPDAEAVTTYPAAVITGYTSRYSRGPSSKRERIYTIALRVAVRTVAGATRRAVLEAFKEAIGVYFDQAVTLGQGGNYHLMEGPNWTLREPVTDGAVTYDEGEFIVKLTDTAAFAA